MPRYQLKNVNNDCINIDEEWRSIDGYDGLYEASNMGRIRRAPTITTECTTAGVVVMERRREPYYLNPTLNCHGYYHVGLTIHNHTNTVAVHILVARAFLSHNEFQTEVHHIDGISTNNNLDNLMWVSESSHMGYHRTKRSRTYLRA